MPLLLLLAACSKASAPTIDVTAINALVPESHRSSISFESRTVDVPGKHGLRYVIPVPKGWRPDKVHPTELHAPAALGTETYMRVTSSCLSHGVALAGDLGAADRPCAPETWEAIVDKKIQTDFLEVINVEKGPNRRTVFAKGGMMNPDARSITVMWWRTDGVEYFTCYARLEGPAVIEAANAFAKACESVVVTSL